ncbi:MAG: dTMP kinase [Acidimicrobiia bacterium]|nr:dTMP kinase [Acidimicrobiia bacterium]
MNGRGRFIAFEGGEGTGKSTQAGLLAASLDALLTREPGGTGLGEHLRDLVLAPDGVAVGERAEALLFAAARAQHVEEVIRPALESGRHVVTDRFLHSSVAYQGYGRGLPPAEIGDLSRWAGDGLVPDLVVLLEVPPDVAAQRLARPLDRLESTGRAFHERVRAGFRAMAEADPARWVVFDGDRAVDALAATIASVARQRLQLTDG